MNYDFFLVFLLAHLAGDFVLQTDKITKIKAASVKGVAVHSGIVIMAQTLFLSAFGLKGALLGAACGIVHFFIDCVKEMVFKKSRIRIFYFLLDQALHLSIIALISIFLAPSLMLVRINLLYVKISIAAAVLLFAANIIAKILVRDLDVNIRKSPFFLKYERLTDILVCLAVFFIMLLPFAASIPLIGLGFYFYYRLEKFKFNYSIYITLLKYVVYVFIACAMLSFLRLGQF